MFSKATDEPLTLTDQQARVVRYLMKGSTLTNMVAMTCLQIGSLTSRVAELRKLGFKIVSRMDTGSDGRSFKKYDIDPKATQPTFTVRGE